MLTADTITDEQIRELRESNRDGVDVYDTWIEWACERALDHPEQHLNARARCAKILNDAEQRRAIHKQVKQQHVEFMTGGRIIEEAWHVCRRRTDPGPEPSRWRLFAHHSWSMRSIDAKYATPSRADIYKAAETLGFAFYDDIVTKLIEAHRQAHR